MEKWVDVRVRKPTPADADETGCVIVWHTYQGVMVTGWFQVEMNSLITHWMPTPRPPKGKWEGVRKAE